MRAKVRGVLAGSVGGLLAVAGAQAADLPVKAKAPAVEYVRICSLYGAGFYYIPGTDTCLKIGGHLRADFVYFPSQAAPLSVDYNANWDAKATRFFNDRSRAYATFDARSETAYGTLRSYFLIGATRFAFGAQTGDAGPALTPYMIRAFIQLAGFTWGLTTSIFDEYSVTPFHLNLVTGTSGSIGATGIWQWRYTAQFGNGFSANIAVEEPRRRSKPIINDPLAPGATSHVGAEWPNVLGTLNASGPWGRAAVGFAVTDASVVDPFNPAGTSSIDEIGWATMVGAFLRIPGLPGDTFGFQFAYAEGATGFVTLSAAPAPGGLFTTTKDDTDTFGFVTDGVVTGPGSVALTTAWTVQAGYEHAWSKTLKTSLAGGYAQLEYDNAAAAAICVVFARGPGCDPDTKFYNIGSRTTWTPVPNFSVSLDVMYTHIDSASNGPGVVLGPRGNPVGDADLWTTLLRVRRDYWP